MGEEGRVRTREPVREQARMVFEVPEDALPADHPARLLWEVVQTLGPKRLYGESQSRGGPSWTRRAQSGDAADASTTDADARVMKMPDGGFRPGYNVQLATAGSPMGGPRTIVGVRVTHTGPMLARWHRCWKKSSGAPGNSPEVLLADGDHADHESIRAAAARNVSLPVPLPDKSRGPLAARDEPIEAWRARMETTRGQRALPRPGIPLGVDQRPTQIPARTSPCLGARLRQGDVCPMLIAALAHTPLTHAAALAT